MRPDAPWKRNPFRLADRPRNQTWLSALSCVCVAVGSYRLVVVGSLAKPLRFGRRQRFKLLAQFLW